jgi:putative ABC transport system substrate-binding protein
MKKKALALFMATAMTAAMLAGCGSASDSSASTEESSTEDTAAAEETAEEAAGGDEDTASADTEEATASDKVYNIGICQLLEHDALDAATQGFEDALTDLLGEGNVNFDFQNAQGEQTNCATITTQFVTDGVDLILANATAPLQAAAAATNTIPILGTSITDYATALDISDWTGATGTNISGTSDLAPLDEQENMLVELFPDAKKVGILYCSAEANSVYQAQVFEQYLEEDGIEYEEFTAADSNEIQAVVTSACESVDVIYIPTDNTMAANTETVNNVALPAGVPIIAGEEGICGGCGVATLSISYYDIGYTAGEMAYDILVNGADITTMDVKFAPQVTKEYNASICETLGITVPDDYVAIATE